MQLLVDIGNTRVKWLLWQGNTALARGALAHRKGEDANLGEHLWSRLPRPEQVVLASVAADGVTGRLRDWTTRAWDMDIRVVTSRAAACGVVNAYAQPQRLGVDRWVALIGARHLVPGAACVVDCGTAVTVDALAPDGQHLGGVILPGAGLMRRALYADTSRIPPEHGRPTVFGRDTQDCVWGGTLHAAASAVDQVTRRMMDRMARGRVDTAGAEAITPLLLGGDAEPLLPYLQGPYRLEPDLIFHGLRAIADQAA